MRTVFIAPFDPITHEEIQWINEYRRKNHVQDVFLMPWNNGVLSISHRLELIRIAVGAYHRLHTTDHILKDDRVIYIDEEISASEEKVYHANFHSLEKSLKAYLLKSGDYDLKICQTMCKPKRAVHAKSVADVCVELASVHHLNVAQAYKAGLLHDITKKCDIDFHTSLLKRYAPEILQYDPAVYHSFTAAIYLRQNMDLHDEEVLHAIAHHTLGDGERPLDKVLYIADKIEPTRGYDTTYHFSLAYQDLTKAAEYILEESKKYILQKEGKHV